MRTIVARIYFLASVALGAVIGVCVYLTVRTDSVSGAAHEIILKNFMEMSIAVFAMTVVAFLSLVAGVTCREIYEDLF